MKDFVAYIRSLYPEQEIIQIPAIQRAYNAQAKTIPVKEILKYAKHHEILSHSWLIAFKKGLLSKQVIEIWLHQRYLLSWCFPNWLTSVVAKLTTPQARIPLLHNLYEEHGLFENSSHSGKPHPQMWQQLFEELGISMVGESLPLPISEKDLVRGTQVYIQIYTEACFNNSVFVGLGAMGFTEAILPFENKLILEGLQKLGISRKGQEFFQLHCECDVDHANEIIYVLEKNADSPEEIQQVWQGIELAVAARKAFYDTLLSISLEHKLALDIAIQNHV